MYKAGMLRVADNINACRYVYQHGYNLSMPELVDRIASPTVKASMLEWTYKKLDSFPTPLDYANALASGDHAMAHAGELVSEKAAA